MKRFAQTLCGLMSIVAPISWGAQVHVVWQTSTDGEVKEQGDALVVTDEMYTTCEAPRIDGYVFTGWTIDTKQTFVSRDDWGRSLDSVSIVVYEPTVLTANYHLETIDSDDDGLCDGKELYWYGNLDQDADSDTDHDGFTTLDEFTQGLNPHLANRCLQGVATTDGEMTDYNPNAYPKLVTRCDPEGELFAQKVSYVKPGETVSTKEFDPYATRFAYWSVNGVRQTDAVGQALNAVTFVMPDADVDTVAVCERLYEDRGRLHWYGDESISLGSDTDGDGRTLESELAAGTNPLLKDRTVSRGVTYARSAITDYNPNGYPRLTIACEPEGILFVATSRYVAAGTSISSSLCRYADGFMGWQINGVRQHDVLGRALDQVLFAMPDQDVELMAFSTTDADEQMQMYWYGDEMISVDSDTDGDGYTLAAEVAAGTNPLLKDRTLAKGICTAKTATREVDIQFYEQATGVLVDGKFEELFTAPYAGNAATSMTFADGAQIWPVVADVNGDGLWDLIVCSAIETNVFVNAGTKGNPQFAKCGSVGADVPGGPLVDLDMNSTAKLASMALDVAPVGALSATTNGATLLVSDDEGRIWYYINDAIETIASTWVLQHKVWGGSFAGFADGLMLAAVDWEDDGDLDCICGTAEGKLMLLRDPKVGRPTGLTAEAGVDNVLLSWEPNGGSRVYGYRVYRNDVNVASPSLPRHRDYPDEITDYDYKVSALSRFYTAGNSEPLESESVATAPVRAELGRVSFRWSDAAGFVGEEIAVDLALQNSLNVAGEGLSLSVRYDSAVLQPVCVRPSGLTTNVTFAQAAASGVWNVTATGGEIAAGGGTFFSFVFKGLVETNATPVVLASATMQSVGGAKIPAVLPSVDANVKIEKFEEPERMHAQVTMTESAQVTAGESFAIEVSAVGEDIDTSSLSFDYVFDHSLLTRSGNTFTALDVTNEAATLITLTNVTARAIDGSDAVIDSVGVCSVAIATASGGESGHFANLSLGSAKGKIGETVDIDVGVKGAFRTTTVDLKAWRFSVSYDGQLLRPVGLVAANGAYGWSATNGVMSVVGTSGTLDIGKLLSGWKYPVALRFELLTQYAKHQTDVSFVNVEMKATNGEKVFTPVRESGSVFIEFVRPAEDPSVVVPYSRGDLNGNGRLTKEDKQLLAELMNGKGGKGKSPTAEQLRAGDYNGNGRLDQDDYQLMKDDFKARGIK